MKYLKIILNFFFFLIALDTVQSQNEKVAVKGDLAVKGEITTNDFNCPSISLSGKLTAEKAVIASNLISSHGITKKLYVDKLIPPQGTLDIYGDLLLSDPVVVQTLEAPSVQFKGVALWQLVQHEDFENDVNYIVIPSYINSKTAQGWSFSEISNCDHGQVYPNKFIGGPCKLSNQQTTKTFDSLPQHKFLKISAKFHMFDEWKGEYGYMKINDKIMWTKNAITSNETDSINICGQESPDPAYNVQIEVTIPHTADQVKITFGSSLKTDPCFASYGVDDIMIYVK